MGGRRQPGWIAAARQHWQHGCRSQASCYQHLRSCEPSVLPAKCAAQLLERRSLAGGGLASGGRGGARQGRRAWWCRHEGLRPLLGRLARLAGVGGGASKWAGPVCRPGRAAGYESTRLGTADYFCAGASLPPTFPAPQQAWQASHNPGPPASWLYGACSDQRSALDCRTPLRQPPRPPLAQADGQLCLPPEQGRGDWRARDVDCQCWWRARRGEPRGRPGCGPAGLRSQATLRQPAGRCRGRSCRSKVDRVTHWRPQRLLPPAPPPPPLVVVACPIPSSLPNLPRHSHTPAHTQVHNPNGALRVVVTKALPGDRWLKVWRRLPGG